MSNDVIPLKTMPARVGFIHSGNRMKEMGIVTSIGNIVREYIYVHDSLQLLAQEMIFF